MNSGPYSDITSHVLSVYSYIYSKCCAAFQKRVSVCYHLHFKSSINHSSFPSTFLSFIWRWYECMWLSRDVGVFKHCHFPTHLPFWCSLRAHFPMPSVCVNQPLALYQWLFLIGVGWIFLAGLQLWMQQWHRGVSKQQYLGMFWFENFRCDKCYNLV